MPFTVKYPIATCNSMARVVWEIVNHYVKTHPSITLGDLRAVFAGIPSNPEPLICEWINAINHRRRDGTIDPQPRWCINNPSDKIALPDGHIVTVSNQWQNTPTGNFPIFCGVAKRLGYDII